MKSLWGRPTGSGKASAVLLLCLSAVIALAGCGGEQTSPAADTPGPCGTHGRVRTVCDGQCRYSAGAHGDGGSSGYTCSNTDSAADTRSGGNSRGNAATHCAADLDSLAHRNCYAGTNSDSNARTGTHQHADSGADGDSDHHARPTPTPAATPTPTIAPTAGAQPHATPGGASVGGGVLAVAG